MNFPELESTYIDRYSNLLCPTANKLESFIIDLLGDTKRIDRVSVRPKSIDSFMGKAKTTTVSGTQKYSDPLNQIQDQIGARIVCFYLSDVELIDTFVTEYFHRIEDRTVVPDSEFSFGYFGKHYILLTPDDVIDDENPVKPSYFELQIKTLYQHAWSEANHDLQYKPENELDEDFLRRVAFTSAQSWGADQIFEELFQSIQN